MPTINQLSAVDTLQNGDLTAIFSTNNGDARKASLSLLKEFILDNFMNDLDLETTVVVADLDNFVLYDVSTSNTISINATQVRDYVREKIFGDMTAATAAVEDSDKIMIYEALSGATKSITAAELQTYLQSDLISKSNTQYASPSATAFSVQITDNDENTHLILTPTGAFAAGTIVLPLKANVIDKQETLVNCTQDVTTLTIDGNGAVAVTGAPTSLSANDFFTLKYDLLTETWYRTA